MLDRFNSVVGELARPETTIVLLTTEFSFAPEPKRAPSDWPEVVWWRSVEVEDSFWHVYAAEVKWQAQRFDDVVRRVAADATGNVMMCHPACEWVVHPYDGGTDVILASTESRNLLRERFIGWLSSRSDGL